MEGNHLVIPPKTVDSELNESVAVLPPAKLLAAHQPFTGMKVVSEQIMLSSTKGAYDRITFELPKPVSGGNRSVFIGGGAGAVTAQSTPADDLNTDFEIDLSGLDMGLFNMESFVIKHRAGEVGGWFGGGSIHVPAFGASLLAPYKRGPPGGDPSSECPLTEDEVVGPSGLSIVSDGGFEFGGAAFVGSIPVGPVEIRCISVNGTSNPFIIRGRVGMAVPPQVRLITAHVCFMVALLKSGDGPVSGCEATYEPTQDVTWFRAYGGISLLNFLHLGDAYFDLKSGSNLLRIEMGGGIDIDRWSA